METMVHPDFLAQVVILDDTKERYFRSDVKASLKLKKIGFETAWIQIDGGVGEFDTEIQSSEWSYC